MVGCRALPGAEDAPPRAPATPTIVQLDVSPPLYTSLYFRPPTDTIVSDATITEYQLQVVHSQEEAMRFGERIDVIYIHETMLPEIGKNWLRDEFYAGATVVALNIPINTLGEFLGITPGMADLREIEDFFYISMFHHTYDSAGNTSGRGVHSEHYPGFEDIPHGVNTIMWLNGRGE